MEVANCLHSLVVLNERYEIFSYFDFFLGGQIVFYIQYNYCSYSFTDKKFLGIVNFNICQQIFMHEGKKVTLMRRLLSLYTVVAERVGYFVLLNYSYKSWSIIKTEICSS